MNIREKRRRQEKRRGLRWAEPQGSVRELIPIDNASDFVSSFRELYPGDEVLLVARVSNPKQKAHLKQQLQLLRHHVKLVGATVLGSVEHTGSGVDSKWIRKVAAKAKRLGADYVLAETLDRFKRSELFSQVDRSVQPAGYELAELKRHARGVKLMTYLHPDSPLKECEGYQKKRGGVGRPRKHYGPRYSESLAEVTQAIRLHRKGWTYHEIAVELDRPYTTVYKWIKKGLSNSPK